MTRENLWTLIDKLNLLTGKLAHELVPEEIVEDLLFAMAESMVSGERLNIEGTSAALFIALFTDEDGRLLWARDCE